MATRLAEDTSAHKRTAALLTVHWSFAGSHKSKACTLSCHSAASIAALATAEVAAWVSSAPMESWAITGLSLSASKFRIAVAGSSNIKRLFSQCVPRPKPCTNRLAPSAAVRNFDTRVSAAIAADEFHPVAATGGKCEEPAFSTKACMPLCAVDTDTTPLGQCMMGGNLRPRLPYVSHGSVQSARMEPCGDSSGAGQFVQCVSRATVSSGQQCDVSTTAVQTDPRPMSARSTRMAAGLLVSNGNARHLQNMQPDVCEGHAHSLHCMQAPAGRAGGEQHLHFSQAQTHDLRSLQAAPGQGGDVQDAQQKGSQQICFGERSLSAPLAHLTDTTCSRMLTNAANVCTGVSATKITLSTLLPEGATLAQPSHALTLDDCTGWNTAKELTAYDQCPDESIELRPPSRSCTVEAGQPSDEHMLGKRLAREANGDCCQRSLSFGCPCLAAGSECPEQEMTALLSFPAEGARRVAASGAAVHLQPGTSVTAAGVTTKWACCSVATTLAVSPPPKRAAAKGHDALPASVTAKHVAPLSLKGESGNRGVGSIEASGPAHITRLGLTARATSADGSPRGRGSEARKAMVAGSSRDAATARWQNSCTGKVTMAAAGLGLRVSEGPVDMCVLAQLPGDLRSEVYLQSNHKRPVRKMHEQNSGDRGCRQRRQVPQQQVLATFLAPCRSAMKK
jgi:hypothetical protein